VKRRRRTIGPRMRELCRILAVYYGGAAPSKSHVYMEMSYHGQASNFHGSAVMARAIKAGLILDKSLPGTWGKIPVELSDEGWRVARGLLTSRQYRAHNPR
jgi:hypothetical protein